MNEKQRYMKGLLIASTGVAVLSFDALLIRLSGTAGFTAVFYRSLFTMISMSLLFFTLRGKKSLSLVRQGGRAMVISGLMWGLSGAGFTLGIQMAGVANTLVMISLSPLFAAAFSFVFYREKVHLSTIIAALVAIGGIWFIYHKGFKDLNTLGLFFALFTPAFLGSNLAFLRRHESISRMPIVIIGGISGALIALAGSGGKVGTSLESVLPLMVLGLVVIPFAQMMISTGVKYIHAPEAALINSSETVLGVLYVWLFLREAPSADMMIGGSIVLAAISINSVYQARKNTYAPAPSSPEV